MRSSSDCLILENTSWPFSYLTEAMQAIFFTAFIAALLALFATLLTPKGQITQLGAAKPSPDLKLEKRTSRYPALAAQLLIRKRLSPSQHEDK